MRWGRLLLVGVSILSMSVSARASSLTPATRDGALPMRGENSLTNAFPCIGRQIDKSSRGPILITFQHFDDGSVPLSQNGPLNDRGPLSALFAVSNLGTEKVMATSEAEEPRALAALGALYPNTPIDHITLDASFNAYDQRTSDLSKSVDAFFFKFQAGAARDRSVSALHLTGVIMTNGMAAPNGGFRYKAVLLNEGSRANIAVFSDDNELGASFAKSSFQAVGDLEELLVDLAVLTTVQKIFGVSLDACLNAPGGADFAATNEAVYSRMSTREVADGVTAFLFQLGYLQRPVVGFPVEVSRALRNFQARHGLPPDGLPNPPTYLALKRALLDNEGAPGAASITDLQLGKALEAAHTGSRVSWSQGGMLGEVAVTQTFENYQNLHRPCRAFQHVVTIGTRRLVQPERIACRLSEGVWATVN